MPDALRAKEQVVAQWQKLARTRLNPDGIEAMMARPEVDELARMPFALVARAGHVAKSKRPKGNLLLSDWIAAARELAENPPSTTTEDAEPPKKPWPPPRGKPFSPPAPGSTPGHRIHLNGAIPSDLVMNLTASDELLVQRIGAYPSDVQAAAVKELAEDQTTLSLHNLAEKCKEVALRRRAPAKRRSHRRTDSHGVPYRDDEAPERAIERKTAEQANVRKFE